MRVVFDTNLLYSAFVAKGFCEEVVDEAAGACDLVWSDAVKPELESVLPRHQIGPATRVALAAYVDLCELLRQSRFVNASVVTGTTTLCSRLLLPAKPMSL